MVVPVLNFVSDVIDKLLCVTNNVTVVPLLLLLLLPAADAMMMMCEVCVRPYKLNKCHQSYKLVKLIHSTETQQTSCLMVQTVLACACTSSMYTTAIQPKPIPSKLEGLTVVVEDP